MSVRIPSVEGKPSPWTIRTERLDTGVALRISGENATDKLHVRQARILAGRVLELIGASDSVQYAAEVIISEFGANAVIHGEGMGELDIVYSPARGKESEKIDISVVNPTKLKEDRTPGMDMTGELAVRPHEVDRTNDTAEHGRGMDIAHKLAKGHIGQVTKPEQRHANRKDQEQESDEKIVVITHAELVRRRDYNEAA